MTPRSYLKLKRGVLEQDIIPEQDILEGPHGTTAFKDFILSKGYRMPGFLKNCSPGRGGRKYDSKTPIHQVIKINSNVEDAQEDKHFSFYYLFGNFSLSF